MRFVTSKRSKIRCARKRAAKASRAMRNFTNKLFEQESHSNRRLEPAPQRGNPTKRIIDTSRDIYVEETYGRRRKWGVLYQAYYKTGWKVNHLQYIDLKTSHLIQKTTSFKKADLQWGSKLLFPTGESIRSHNMQCILLWEILSYIYDVWQNPVHYSRKTFNECISSFYTIGGKDWYHTDSFLISLYGQLQACTRSARASIENLDSAKL